MARGQICNWCVFWSEEGREGKLVEGKLELPYRAPCLNPAMQLETSHYSPAFDDTCSEWTACRQIVEASRARVAANNYGGVFIKQDP